ncbi:protein kinase domain-containing protein [Cordyceps javanica]|nr:protein kinase domain-containing protein [Cordyceps javanica]
MYSIFSRLVRSGTGEQPVQAVAQPITPPQRAEVPDHVQIIVDYKRKPFSITWQRGLRCPDLSGFPTFTDAGVNPISQTASIRELWTQSMAFSYGSCASIRIQENVPFPILKLAHSSQRFIQMLQREFALLTSMAPFDLPVVQIDQQPILDNGEICGFRMKRLSGMCRSSLISRRSDIQQALRRLHSAGFCHGDIRGDKIMEDEAGRIIFIDFGLGGQIGSDAPGVFPRRIDSGHFTAEHDWNLFNKAFD